MKSIQRILDNEKIWVILDQAIFSGGSFVTTILLARLLNAESFGLFASIILFAYLGISLTGAMVIQPLQVSLAKTIDKESYNSFCFWLQTGLLALLAASSYLLFQFELTILATYSTLGIGVLFFLISFISQDYFRKLFLAQSLVRQALWIDAISVSIQISILTYYFFGQRPVLENLLWYLGLSYFPAILISILKIRPIHYTAAWRDYARMHYQQGKWLILTAFTQWWSSNLFVVASGLFLGMQALGAFRLVQSLFGVLNILLQTFENYVLPETARLLHESHDLAKTHLRTLSLQSAAVFGILLLFIFTFSEQIIVLAGGAEYAEYAFVVKGMAILYLFIFISYPVRMAIRALVLNKHFFQGYLISLLFSLLSFQYLLQEFHLIGAIIGLIGSQIILLIFWQFILSKHNFSLWK